MTIELAGKDGSNMQLWFESTMGNQFVAYEVTVRIDYQYAKCECRGVLMDVRYASSTINADFIYARSNTKPMAGTVGRVRIRNRREHDEFTSALVVVLPSLKNNLFGDNVVNVTNDPKIINDVFPGRSSEILTVLRYGMELPPSVDTPIIVEGKP